MLLHLANIFSYPNRNLTINRVLFYHY